MSPGRLVTFEGPDGSGKSTQLARLAARLREQGREVVETAEPGGTRIGREIREILLNSRNQALRPTAELLLYFASRAQNVEELIRPALARGAVVLSDRFTDSTLVYQGVGRGLGADVVRQLHTIACGTLQPHLTVLVDISPELTLERTVKRATPDRLDAESLDFHRRVREGYLRLAQDEPQRVRLVNGGQSIEAVAEEVWPLVEEALR
ncbi:MAG: dTMP kinase [Bryobacteraceae bacterium]|nr:dTMP kinase [Bryobacteraceae bacterium]